MFLALIAFLLIVIFFFADQTGEPSPLQSRPESNMSDSQLAVA
jgi:hypothetical protein